MPESTRFANLLRLLQQGDQNAASEFHRRYAPEVRAVARVYRVNPSFQSGVSSQDLCQAVFLRFCLQVLPRKRFTTEESLRGYLLKMALNELRTHCRRQATRPRRVDVEPVALVHMAVLVEDLARHIDTHDFLGRVKQLLTEDEWQLLRSRAEGEKWQTIAERVGRSAEAVRRQAQRACVRVRDSLEENGK